MRKKKEERREGGKLTGGRKRQINANAWKRKEMWTG